MTTQHFDSQIWSDLYKDAYGFRPRHDLSVYSDDELDALWLHTVAVHELSIEADRQAQLRGQRNLETTIADYMAVGAQDRAQALRWIADGEDVVNGDDIDVEELLWHFNACLSLTETYAAELVC